MVFFCMKGVCMNGTEKDVRNQMVKKTLQETREWRCDFFMSPGGWIECYGRSRRSKHEEERTHERTSGWRSIFT